MPEKPALPAEVGAADERTLARHVAEALIFASPEPLSEAAIAARLPAGSDIGSVLAELAQDYSGRGIRLVRIGSGWAFRTAPELASHLRLEREVSRKLSRAALEALGIIAYHQPVTRAEIEEIRGVALSRGTLDVLLQAGWIKPGKRRRSPGRPLTWVTTQDFLDHFGLEAIGDLPGLDELKASGLLDARPSVHLLQPAASEDDDAGEEEENDESAESEDAGAFEESEAAGEGASPGDDDQEKPGASASEESLRRP